MILISLISISATAQCDEMVEMRSTRKLEDYTYVKHFSAKSKENSESPEVKTFSLIMSSPNKYRIAGYSSEDYPGIMIIELYGPNGKIAASYDKNTDTHYDKLQFNCRRSGKYTIKTYFMDGSAGCGVASIGFKR